MSRGLEKRVLRWLRVPPEPAAPAGSPGSLRVFRAGRNYIRLRVILWAGAQVGAVFGVLISLSFVRETEIQKELEQIHLIQTSSAPGVQATGWNWDAEARRERNALHQFFYDVAPPWLRELPKVIPAEALPWMWLAEIVGLVGFFLQFVGSFVAIWYDYRLRWYMVTDRSLRLRWGVLNVHESTMSFANLQQVTVQQGPLQRVLGLADVEVQSAGGGSANSEQSATDSLHRSVFHAVDNAAEIRDLILARLQRFRQVGLGDPDDPNQAARASSQKPKEQAAASVSVAPPTLAAARQVLIELREWRADINEPTP